MSGFKNEAYIYNASLEDVSIMIGGRGFTFKARALTQVPFYDLHSRIENIPAFIEREYGEKALVWIKQGENIKDAERQALTRYLQVLDFRLKNYTKDREEYRLKHGHEYPETKQEKTYKHWKEKIIERLELQAPIETIPTFEDDYPDVGWIGDNFKPALETSEDKLAKRVGRPKKSPSFDDLPEGLETTVGV